MLPNPRRQIPNPTDVTPAIPRLRPQPARRKSDNFYEDFSSSQESSSVETTPGQRTVSHKRSTLKHGGTRREMRSLKRVFYGQPRRMTDHIATGKSIPAPHRSYRRQGQQSFQGEVDPRAEF